MSAYYFIVEVAVLPISLNSFNNKVYILKLYIVKYDYKLIVTALSYGITAS